MPKEKQRKETAGGEREHLVKEGNCRWRKESAWEGGKQMQEEGRKKLSFLFVDLQKQTVKAPRLWNHLQEGKPKKFWQIFNTRVGS